MKSILILLSWMLFAGCEPTPEPIAFGHDECAYCRMIVSERGFGSRLLTEKGRTYTFDSIECLAAFEIRGDVATANIHSRLFQNLDDPSRSLHLDEAHIRHDPDVRSPMGLSLSAHAAVPTSGRMLEWNEVLAFVAQQWSVNK